MNRVLDAKLFPQLSVVFLSELKSSSC